MDTIGSRKVIEIKKLEGVNPAQLAITRAFMPKQTVEHRPVDLRISPRVLLYNKLKHTQALGLEGFIDKKDSAWKTVRKRRRLG